MITVNNLRERLGLEKSEYKTMEAFKRRVIDLAIKEISEKTDIKATYEQHKAGRKIIGFTFKFKKAKNKITEASQRNKNTLDIFAPIKMTDKQRSFFGRKLADLNECSQLPHGNESYEALGRWIAEDLLKPERTEFYRPLLAKVGYKE